MRGNGIWHSGLTQAIVSMRHHDTLVVADAGLPVPSHVPTIELCWARGEPRLLPVLAAILEELVVERATVATEATDAALVAGLQAELDGIPIDRVDHESLKRACGTASVVVRTGDDTPYANVILHGGVPFGSPGSWMPDRTSR